jgi:hypothetical protein
MIFFLGQILDMRRIEAVKVKPVFLALWEEGVFKLEALHEQDGLLIASGGKVALILPLEMAPKLNDLIGHRIGIIRCENGFRFRIYEDKSTDLEA